MIIYTFCVDIGKFPQSTLLSVANAWIEGIISSGTQFDKLIIYSNMPLRVRPGLPKLEIRKFDASLAQVDGETIWNRLNASKLIYYREIWEEQKKAPVWIDLDTFVANEISDLDEMGSFCTMLGTQDARPMKLHKSRDAWIVPRNRLLHGSFFKLTLDFLDTVEKVLADNRGELAMAEQDALNIAYHVFGKKIPVLGKDVFGNRLFSFEAWSSGEAVHIDETNSSHLFRTPSGDLCTMLHPGKKVDVVQFTFSGAHRFLSIPDDEATWFIRFWQSQCKSRHIAAREDKPAI